MNLGNFFSELKRRNVYKVAVSYAIVGWLLVHIATQVFPFLEIPNWVVRLVIAIVVIGFFGLGDKADAVHWLEEGYRDGDGDALGVIRVDPPLDPLHGDSRFEALAGKIVPARQFRASSK